MSARIELDVHGVGREVAVPFLGEEASMDPALVGNKAASLGRLAADWPVPPGFCMPVDLHGVVAYLERSAGMRLLDTLIRPRYEKLFQGGTRVAVRSSAVDEDTGSASFAGQYTTVLDAGDLQTVCEAVLTCYDSAASNRVQGYRDEHGLQGDRSMGVLIQELVPAEASGVVFSIDPISGDDARVMINSSWGLGSAVVDGLVTPDIFVLSKESMSMIDLTIADKDIAVTVSAGGIEEIRVDAGRRSQPSLDARQCHDLAGMAIQLEDEMGWPVDIEFAYADGELSLLQCRPVTAR